MPPTLSLAIYNAATLPRAEYESSFWTSNGVYKTSHSLYTRRSLSQSLSTHALCYCVRATVHSAASHTQMLTYVLECSTDSFRKKINNSSEWYRTAAHWPFGETAPLYLCSVLPAIADWFSKPVLMSANLSRRSHDDFSLRRRTTSLKHFVFFQL